MSASGAALSSFRLGENAASDASDSDQSAHSERSLSPSGGVTKKSKAKKRKDRRQVGALTDELGTLLGAAFQTPSGDSVKLTATAEGAEAQTEDPTMEIDATSTVKKLPKRTRQNIAKMEKRNLERERQQQDRMGRQIPVPGTQGLPQAELQKRQKQDKKSTTNARRLRKERERARKLAGQGDAMEIG